MTLALSYETTHVWGRREIAGSPQSTPCVTRAPAATRAAMLVLGSGRGSRRGCTGARAAERQRVFVLPTAAVPAWHRHLAAADRTHSGP